MDRKVYLTKWSASFPTLQTEEDWMKAWSTKSYEGNWGQTTLPCGTPFFQGKLDFSKDELKFIQRKDQKILSLDLKSALVTLKNMMENTKGIELESTAVLTCTSLSFDRIQNDILDFCDGLLKDWRENGKLEVESSLSPLMGLKALTNSANSYISQYMGMHGENTTFGNTSYDTWGAIDTAIEMIQSGKTKSALVGAMNATGELSALTYLPLVSPKEEKWVENTGSSFLLLESKPRDNESIELAKSFSNSIIPSLKAKSKKNYESISGEIKKVIHSGGIADSHYEKEFSTLEVNHNVKSWYPIIGPTGVCAPILNVIAGALELNQNKDDILCLDRDVYGRESGIQLRGLKK